MPAMRLLAFSLSSPIPRYIYLADTDPERWSPQCKCYRALKRQRRRTPAVCTVHTLDAVFFPSKNCMFLKSHTQKNLRWNFSHEFKTAFYSKG